MEPPREDASDPPPSDVDSRSIGSRSRRDDASAYSADSSASSRSHCSAGSRRRSPHGRAAEPAPRRTDAPPGPDANRTARSDGDWYCDEMRDLHRDSDLETLGGYADGRHKIRFAEQVFRPPPSSSSSTEDGRTNKGRRGGRAASSFAADSASSESSASASVPSIRASSSHYSPPNVNVKVFARQRGFVKKNMALLALSAVLVVAMLVGNIAETEIEAEAEGEGGATSSARAQRRLVDARGGARAPASGVWGKVPAFLRGLFSSEAVGAADEGFAAAEERQDPRDRGTGGTGVAGEDYEEGTPEADPNPPAFPAIQFEKVRTPQEDQRERHLRKGVGGEADGGPIEATGGVPLVDPVEFRRQQEELEGKGADVAEGGGADVEELGDGSMGHYDQQAPPDQLAQMMHQVQMEREQQGLPVAQPAPMEQQVPTEQQAQMDQQAQAEQQAQIAQQAQVIAQLTPEEQRAQVEALEQQAAALRQQTADVRQLYSNVVHTLKNSA